MQKIILIGYMGVGKTTIAQLLAKKMKIDWIDLDKVIEYEAKLSIKNIFDQKGEIYFRKLEHILFKKMIEKDQKVIISTGGGTPCYSNNHLLLNKENCTSIYLKASVDTLLYRLKAGGMERPLIVDKTEAALKEFIAKNLFDRSYYYNQATYNVLIDDKNPERVVDEIYELLH